MKDDFGNSYEDDGGKLEEAIGLAITLRTQESYKNVLEALRTMAKEGRKLLVPVASAHDKFFTPLIMGYNDSEWIVGYTSMETVREVCLEEKVRAVSIYDFIECSSDYDGVMINPIQGECFPMNKELIRVFKDGCGWE